MFRRRALTLVEFVIIALVLGILAMVVVPQFSRAGGDPRLGSLRISLQWVRGQIELYRVQHEGRHPRADLFVRQLTGRTRPDGTPCDTPDEDCRCGPYLQVIPVNPYTLGSRVGEGPVGTSDWHYDPATGAFRANDHTDRTRY